MRLKMVHVACWSCPDLHLGSPRFVVACEWRQEGARLAGCFFGEDIVGHCVRQVWLPCAIQVGVRGHLCQPVCEAGVCQACCSGAQASQPQAWQCTHDAAVALAARCRSCQGMTQFQAQRLRCGCWIVGLARGECRLVFGSSALGVWALGLGFAGRLTAGRRCTAVRRHRSRSRWR